jgi:hypothetical protein
LFAVDPKKFVTNKVTMREKLKAILISPRMSFPKVLATKILKTNGTSPINARARTV